MSRTEPQSTPVFARVCLSFEKVFFRVATDIVVAATPPTVPDHLTLQGHNSIHTWPYKIEVPKILLPISGTFVLKHEGTTENQSTPVFAHVRLSFEKVLFLVATNIVVAATPPIVPVHLTLQGHDSVHTWL